MSESWLSFTFNGRTYDISQSYNFTSAFEFGNTKYFTAEFDEEISAENASSKIIHFTNFHCQFTFGIRVLTFLTPLLVSFVFREGSTIRFKIVDPGNALVQFL